MIELLVVVCLYPLSLKDGTSKLTPIAGEVIDQNTSHMVKINNKYTDGWKINFSKSLKRLGLYDVNIPVMTINSNDCLVKESKEVNYEPE